MGNLSSTISLSLLVCFSSATLSLFFASVLVYILNRTTSPMREIIETILLLPMVLPPSVIGYLLLYVFNEQSVVGSLLLEKWKISIIFSPLGCIISAFVVSLPLAYQSLQLVMKHIPKSVLEAGKVDGANHFALLRYIFLPLTIHGIVSAYILTFARSLGEFGATLILAGNIPGKTQTLSTAIYYAMENGQEQFAKILILFVITLSYSLLFISKRFIFMRGESHVNNS